MTPLREPPPPALGLGAALLWTSLGVASTRLAFLVIAQLWAMGHALSASEAASTLATEPLALGLAQLLGLVPVAWFALSPAQRNGEPLRALGFHPVPALWLLLAWVGGLGLQLPLAELGTLGRSLWPLELDPALRTQRMLARADPAHLLGLSLSLGLLAPLLEEALFRGALQPRLQTRYGAPVGIALSALLFGASHLLPPMVLYASAAGAILGLLRLHSGSTWVAVAAHAGVNSLPLLLPGSVLPIPGFNVPDPAPRHVPWPWLAAGSLLATAAFSTLWHLSGHASRPDRNDP